MSTPASNSPPAAPSGCPGPIRTADRRSTAARFASRSRRALAALALSAAACLGLASAPSALASSSQVALFEDDIALMHDPAGTLAQLRGLGVTMVRLNVRWSSIAPSPTSRVRPSFNAADSNTYPPGAWSSYDTIVRQASLDGIRLMFTPTGFAPLWAQGANPQKYGAHYDPAFAFMPSPNEYQQFVTALARRYPSVHTWELYNEPNFGEDLSPQGINHSKVLYAPVLYRALANAGFNALRASGHGRDTILVGALAAHGAQIPAKRGFGLPGAYGETAPLTFIRELYCLSPRNRPYQGAAARIRKCPATKAASRRFRAQNPSLFSTSAWSVHPYPLGSDGGSPPTSTVFHNPNFVGFSQLPNMLTALDRIQRVYHSRKRFSLWNTEYGYITNPPNRSARYVSPDNQAYYDNWAEYLAWKNSRVASTMQYLLYDPNPSVGTPECGGFASGLVYYSSAPVTAGCGGYVPGSAKPAYQAYRLPIYMPSGAVRAGRAASVWGCVRPAHFALVDTFGPQVAQIQFQRGSIGPWITLATVSFDDPASSCYFLRQVLFPASGSVRLAYAVPVSDLKLDARIGSSVTSSLTPAISRTLPITVN